MPHRLKLIVAYDGAHFAGWQSQAGGNTIQDHLEARASTASPAHSVRVHGAGGRTPASMLWVNARTSMSRRKSWTRRALGARAQCVRCRRRFGFCKARVMLGDVSTRDFRPRAKPIATASGMLAFFHRSSIGAPGMCRLPRSGGIHQRGSAVFVGTHDFAAFAANRGKPEESTVRTIRRVDVQRRGSSITIEFAGDGFLYKMVRLMVGALVRCGLGKMPAGRIRELLRIAGKQHCGRAVRRRRRKG